MVVLIQYRMNILGFFNTFDVTNNSPVGGNYGVADAALALEFIHNNAVLLGANPSKIVVNGESAGAGFYFFINFYFLTLDSEAWPNGTRAPLNLDLKMNA